MTKTRELYRCPVCGNIVQVLHAGALLSCCGRPMAATQANTSDGAHEKHLPVIEMKDGMIHVKVGSTDHPMEERHHIEWIELSCARGIMRKELHPGDAPEAFFPLPVQDTCTQTKCCPAVLTAQAYCNLHGLWACTERMRNISQSQSEEPV